MRKEKSVDILNNFQDWYPTRRKTEAVLLKSLRGQINCIIIKITTLSIMQ